ncbi:MAG: hypothetical protein WD491_01205 [Balneolales bacterium]
MPYSRIRNIFIFFLIFLPVQYGVVGILGHYHTEPWPAFVFPGFKNVYDGEKGISFSVPQLSVILADSSKKDVRVQDLLNDAPYSHHKAIMNARFNSGALEDMDLETKAWLYTRLISITKKTEISYFTVEWNKMIHKLDDGKLIVDSNLVSTDSIYFNE